MILPINNNQIINRIDSRHNSNIRSESQMLLENLPFSSLSVEEIAFSSKITQFDNKLSSELETLLFNREVQIETHLSELESAHKDYKVVKALIETQKWTHEAASGAKDIVKEGVGFLEDLLPIVFIDVGRNISALFEHLEQITKLGGTFLAALDSGAAGVALIYKGKILKATQLALQKLITEYNIRKKAYLKLDNNLFHDTPTQLAKDSRKAELLQMKKAINLLKKELKVKEKEWYQDRGKFTKKTTKTTLLSFAYLMTALDSLFTYAQLITNTIYTALNSIGLIFSFFALKAEIGTHKAFKDFVDLFNKWKAKNNSFVTENKKVSQAFPLSESQTRNSTLTQQERIEIYTSRFIEEFKSIQTIEEVRTKLSHYGVQLPEMILAEFHVILEKKELPSEAAAFKEKAILAFTQYSQAIEAFDATIQLSESLLKKRQTIMAKKIFLALPQFDKLLPKIEEFSKNVFYSEIREAINNHSTLLTVQNQLKFFKTPIDLPANVIQSLLVKASIQKIEIEDLKKFTDLDIQFHQWFEPQISSKEILLASYLDHQATIEQITKNALAAMLTKKQELNAPFIKMKLAESATFFTLSLSLTGVNTALWIIGLLTTPIGGLGLLFFGLSIPSLVFSLAFTCAQLINNQKIHPQLTSEYRRGATLKLLYAGLGSALAEYKQASLQKKLLSIAEVVRKLHVKSDLKDEAAYNLALKNYEKAKKDFALNQEKVDNWAKRLKTIQDKLSNATWQDFAGQADLKIGQIGQFDTLNAFNHALKACDVDLLSSETKELMEVHLGMDLKVIQKSMSENPILIKTMLQNFFTLEESDYIHFIHTQKQRFNI